MPSKFIAGMQPGSLLNKVADALGLSQSVRRINIDLAADGVPVLRIEQLLSEEEERRVQEALAEFGMKLTDEPVEVVGQWERF